MSGKLKIEAMVLREGSIPALLLILLFVLAVITIRAIADPMGFLMGVMTPSIEKLSGPELEAFLRLQTFKVEITQPYQLDWAGDFLTLPAEFEALVNGKPVRFEVDTGSTNDVSIPPEVAIAAQIPIVKQEEPEATAYGFIDSYSGVIASLKIGEIEIKNVPVHIEGARVIWKLFGIIPIGRASPPTLGFPFLQRVVAAMTLDPQQHTITLWNRASEIDVATARMVPFEVVSDQIALEAFVEGKGPYKFMLDSGNPFDIVVVVSEDLASELKAVKKMTKITQIADARFKFPIKELRFSQMEFKNILGVAAAKEHPVSVLGQFFDGVIGMGLFKNQRITIDFRNQKLYFEGLEAKR